MKKIILIILLNFIFSQVTTDLSFQTSRSISMAGAVVANPGDVESIFYNPAGLSIIKKSELLFGTTQYYGLDFIDYSYLSFVLPTSFGNIGIGYQQLGTKPVNSSAQEYLSNESSLSFSQGFSLLDDRNSSLHIGYTLNILMLDQGQSAGISGDGSDGKIGKTIYEYGIDLGILSSLRNKVQIGVFIKNINSPSIGRGSSMQYLPRKLSVGISYTPFNNLNTSLAFERLLGHEDLQFRFGFEYKFNSLFTLRSGIQIKPNSFGFGFTYSPINKLNISYGLLAQPVMPETHNFELSVLF